MSAVADGAAGLRRSPLHDVHVAAGAVMTGFAGWELPLRYGSETAEHLAVRSAAGVFDLSHMGEIEIRGPQAADLLDAVLVGDMSAIRPGRAKYTLLCDESGGVVDDLVVYRLADEDFLVVANAANVTAVCGALSAAADVHEATVTDATVATALVAVQGPAAPGVVASLTPAPVLDLKRYGCTRADVAGVPAVVGRTGYTGEDGFEIYVPAAAAPGLWEAVRRAGADAGLVPVGLAARDTLRLEAGMALYGHELTRETSPSDAGLGRLVAIAKAADFPGKQALAAAGEPRRALVGVVAQGRRILRPGTSLCDDTGSAVGAVTSGAWSPSLQRSIAMAYVPGSMRAAGTALVADVRGSGVPVTVTDLPFHSRSGGSA